MLPVLLALVPGAQEPATPAAPDLQALLEALVDLPEAGARDQEAARLARLEGVSLDDWLEAMASFGRFEAAEPGMWRREVELPVGGDPRPLRLHGYIPRSYDPARPAPLLVLGHGTGGTGESMILTWRAVAEELGLLLLAPDDGGENTGYRFDGSERQETLAALRWMRRHYNVDENRIHLSGISRGGHLTWDLGLRRPDRWASLAPMVGGPAVALTGGRNNLRLLENIARLPLLDLQGEGDDPGLHENLQLAFEGLERLGAPSARLLEFPDFGHSFDFQAVDWKAFLGSARRDPRPRRVVLRADRPRGARSYWVEAAQLDKKVAAEFRPVFGRAEVARWNEADNLGRKRMIQDLAEERTARIEAEWTGPGSFRVETRLVPRLRLLLDRSMLPPEGRSVKIVVNGRRRTRKAEEEASVLLADFADRFDRSFLPVAEVRLKGD